MGKIRALDKKQKLSSARISPMASRSLLRGVSSNIANEDTMFSNLKRNSLIDSFPFFLFDGKKSCMLQCPCSIKARSISEDQ